MDFIIDAIMNPQHYRLGNLLREVNSGKIVEVIGLEKSVSKLTFPTCHVTDFKIEVSGSFSNGWKLEEIPLRLNHLSSFGFEFGGGKEGHTLTKDKLVLGLTSIIFWQDIEVKTVSQLQNLFLLINEYDLDTSALNPEPIPKP